MYLFIGVATAIEFTVFETFVQITNKLNFPKEMELMASGFWLHGRYGELNDLHTYRICQNKDTDRPKFCKNGLSAKNV